MGPLFSLLLLAAGSLLGVALCYFIARQFRLRPGKALMSAIAALVGAGLGGMVAAAVGVLVLGTEATLASGLQVAAYLGSLVLFALIGAAVAIRVVVRSNNSLQRP